VSLPADPQQRSVPACRPPAAPPPCREAPCLCGRRGPELTPALTLVPLPSRARSGLFPQCRCQAEPGAGGSARPLTQHAPGRAARRGRARLCPQRGGTRCHAPVMWIWREGWHPASPPRSSGPEPSAGAGLDPPQPWQPPRCGAGCSRGRAPGSCHARRSLAADTPGPPALRAQLPEAQRGGAANARHPQHPTSSPSPRAQPRSPGAIRAQPRRTAPARQPSAALRCCGVAEPQPLPTLRAGWALGVHPRQGALGLCAGVWGPRALGCPQLRGTAPRAGARAGSDPAWLAGASARRPAGAAWSGRKGSASPSSSARAGATAWPHPAAREGAGRD